MEPDVPAYPVKVLLFGPIGVVLSAQDITDFFEQHPFAWRHGRPPDCLRLENVVFWYWVKSLGKFSISPRIPSK